MLFSKLTEMSKKMLDEEMKIAEFDEADEAYYQKLTQMTDASDPDSTGMSGKVLLQYFLVHAN
jgi:hypothetical protein